MRTIYFLGPMLREGDTDVDADEFDDVGVGDLFEDIGFVGVVIFLVDLFEDAQVVLELDQDDLAVGAHAHGLDVLVAVVEELLGLVQHRVGNYYNKEGGDKNVVRDRINNG